jgi:P27 family predicted phage terminase small subunit
MAGRKPKPTALKELAGNPGKRALNRREPKPASGLPPCPRHLTGEARKEWRRMGGELARMGVVTAVDRAALAAYCQAWARWVEAEGQVAKLGTIVKTANGNLIQNPYLAVANRAMEQMTRLAAEFGMTPSSRSRVQVQAGEDGPSLADLLFADVQEMTIDGEEERHAER